MAIELHFRIIVRKLLIVVCRTPVARAKYEWISVSMLIVHV